ncbi:hypothetical protein [Protaetiibacter intestinalis]|uniref:Uncharacterized protein n=1 Tax=Protaetiibacter intestinalis TaxID=2419774 RepID=A0A387B587_9MICO|nr:hypothetical protein [Protaetiibacter intestinalis]AYF98854.1 hypothetical protein D7I47_11725 [Protaetiibacter intestinalis]
MNDLSDETTARLRAAAAASPAPDLDPAVVAGAPGHHAPRLVRKGRAVRAAGVSVAAVAAVSVGALVIANPFAAPAALFAAGGGSPVAAGAEDSALSADSRLALWTQYEYLAGAGLSTDGGRGTVYELRRTGDPEAVLARAARALGLDGEVHASSWSTPEYPTWIVGPEDGTAPSASVTWTGTGSWWYSDPTASPAPVCVDVPVEETPDGTTGGYQDCTQPEVPASESLAPSEAEARDLAAELFDATGFPVKESDIRVTADAWQTTASASLVVDGVATALEASVAWSTLGRITWATGHSVEVVARGDYDTVSAASAVDRLDDGRWYGAAGPDYTGSAVLYAADSGLARDGVAVSSGEAEPPVPSDGDGSTGGEPVPAPTEPADPGDPGVVLPDPGVTEPGTVPGTEPTDPPLVDPIPEPLPTPETVTVTLDHAEATLLLMWDVDGNAWLVPGYAYEIPEQDYWTTIVSLVEGVITLPEPAQIEPLSDEAAY